MDVHPPEHGIHSWRDFLVHMGTICLGLVIALALEAGVEGLHHLQERHQLQRDLRAEGERDLAITAADIRNDDADRVWLLQLRHDVDTMQASGGKIKLPYRPEPKLAEHSAMPSDAVWSTAKESSLVGLLPREQAEVYARLYREGGTLEAAMEAQLGVETEVLTFNNRFDDAGPKSVPDLSRMSVEELGEYFALLTKYLTFCDRTEYWSKVFAAADRAVLSGSENEEEMLRRMSGEMAK